MQRIAWVLFDLGGVLVEVSQSRIFDRLGAVTGLAPAEVKRRLLAAQELWHTFTISEVTPAQLAEQVSRLLTVQIAESVVVQAFNAELGPEIAATSELLPKLRRKTQIGCLSNTNSIHWDELLRSYSFMNHFDRRFASQLLGCAKPERAIYTSVVGLLGVKPHEILFFDDREENVFSARQAGWNAHLYKDHTGLEGALSEFSLL
jgi:HAD superfamily hydrolase (TIGR01509 family)